MGSEALLRKDEGDFLIFETKQGSAKLVSEKMLEDILKQCKTDIELVFVSSCHSELIGNIFFKAGIGHVICIKESEKISDEASITFAKAFYHSLFSINGKSICDAFAAAKATVKLQGGIDSCGVGEDNKYRMLSNCKGKCKIFDTDLSHGSIKDVSRIQEILNLPPRVENFVGRAKESQKIVELLCQNSLVNVTGISGIGKSAIVKELSHYISSRGIAKDGVLYCSLDSCRSLESFTKRLVILVNKKQNESAKNLLKISSAIFNDDLISTCLNIIKGKVVLIILDNCDMIMKYDYSAFHIFIEKMLNK